MEAATALVSMLKERLTNGNDDLHTIQSLLINFSDRQPLIQAIVIALSVLAILLVSNTLRITFSIAWLLLQACLSIMVLLLALVMLQLHLDLV